MGNRKMPKAHGKDTGHSSISIGPGASASPSVGGGVATTPGNSGMPEMPAPDSYDVPRDPNIGTPPTPPQTVQQSWFQRLLPTLPGTRDQNNLNNQINLAQYVQDQENFRKRLEGQQALTNTAAVGDQARLTGMNSAATKLLADRGLVPNYDNIATAGKASAPFVQPTFTNAGNTAVQNSAAVLNQANVLNTLNGSAEGQESLRNMFLAQNDKAAAENAKDKATTTRLGVMELGPGGAIVNAGDVIPGTRIQNRPGKPMSFAPDGKGGFVPTSATDSALVETYNGQPVTYKPKVSTVAKTADSGSFNSGEVEESNPNDLSSFLPPPQTPYIDLSNIGMNPMQSDTSLYDRAFGPKPTGPSPLSIPWNPLIPQNQTPFSSDAEVESLRKRLQQLR